MQTLFAFQQSRLSNRELAWQNFKQSLTQENGASAAEGELLKKAIEKVIKGHQEIELQEIPEELRDRLVEIGSTCRKQDLNDLKHLRNNMLKEVEGVKQLFFWVLGLSLALADYEDQRFGQKKLNSGGIATFYFAGNRALTLLQERVKGLSIPSWSSFGDRLSQWYKELTQHVELSRISEERTGLEGDIKFLRFWYKSILWKSESFQDFFEEHDMGWAENQPIIKSMISKTLKSISEEGVELAPLSYQWEDDKQFFEDIFDNTLELESWAENLVSSHAKNWDMERIAQVDMVLLKMALTEMIKFPSIPVKVTINEYIELSKRYSTPKSKKFINGILDVLANELVADGTIKKSGRGLIDNK